MAQNIVKCQQCGTALDLSSFAVGQTVACPCGAHLTVPPPQEPQQAGPPGAQPGGRPQWQQGSSPTQFQQPPPPQYGPPPPQYGPPPMASSGLQYVLGSIPCKEANDALIMAIIGIFCVGIILGPIAIAKASKAQRMIAADPRLAGAGKASAAMIIGIIVTILSAIGIIGLISRGAGS